MQSIWQQTVQGELAPPRTLQGNIQTQVLIVGGGMAGMLCAHRLNKAGIQCVVVEGNRVGSGATGCTTAKVTAQHGLLYADLLATHGFGWTQTYHRLQQQAVEEYRALAESIDFDFEEKTAYVYTTRDHALLTREARAYEILGISGYLEKQPPLPLSTNGALGMAQQAQCHPLKLLQALQKKLDVYEHTLVTDIKGHTAFTAHGRIEAEHIVLATHFPMINVPGGYFAKMFQHRSYVIALEDGPRLDGMYVDEREDGLSFRNYENLLFIGGGDHKTGQQGGGYAPLEALAREAYGECPITHRWATQDCISLDNRPYIGTHRRSTPELLVATGFNKWGMTGSMAASLILEEIVREGRSQYDTLISPRRSLSMAPLMANVLNAAGNLLSFGKRCSHLGCALKWNKAERSWDCPCHGSRFNEEGQVIDNPAKRGIRA